MAEHEFERFLEVLSKLLKLSSKETAAVADEICDHLEERYSELVNLGIARDDAVRQALDEFDDAGEFAAKLNRLVRQRTRRRIMTGALSTAAASALAILVTTAFWPDQRAGQGPALTAIGQNAGKKSTERKGESEIVYIDHVRYLPESFLKPVDVDLNDVELEPFAKFVQELTGYPVILDTNELNNAGVGPDQKLNMKTFGAPIYLVMDRVLADVGGTELAWDLDDEVISITTREKADTLVRAHTVDVSGLLDDGYTMTEIINLLQQHTSGPWMDVDGDGGTMTPLGTRLTFGQTQRGRFEILSILEGLKTPGRRIAIDQPELNRRVQSGLTARVTCDYQDKELKQVLEDLDRQADVPIDMDQNELTNAGLTGDEKVTLSLPASPLQRVLKILLADIGGVELSAFPEHGVLFVTTREKSETYQKVEIFDVSDLVAQDEMQQLAQLIGSGASGHWRDWDGDGGAITVVPKQRIIVRQTRVSLESIQKLLSEHRRIAAATPARPKPDPNAIETRYYRMTEAQAIELAESIPSIVAVNSWKQQLSDLSMPGIHKITVSGTPLKSGVHGGAGGAGFFQIGGMGGGTAAANSGSGDGAESVTSLLKELLQEVRQRPTPAESAVAVLVIRQTRRVHAEIEKFLNDLVSELGAWPLSPMTNPGGFGGGGLGGGGMGGGLGGMGGSGVIRGRSL